MLLASGVLANAACADPPCGHGWRTAIFPE
jgi:hypothetical protein